MKTRWPTDVVKKKHAWNNVKSMFYIETKAWNDGSLWAMFSCKLRSICQLDQWPTHIQVLVLS
jgi:hypothetical protein